MELHKSEIGFWKNVYLVALKGCSTQGETEHNVGACLYSVECADLAVEQLRSRIPSKELDEKSWAEYIRGIRESKD
jgi:hypothetical protein